MKRWIGAIALVGATVLTAGVANAQVVYVRERRPPMVREVRMARPSGQHVWIGGYHHWDGNRWVWNQGRWEVPAQPRARWIPPQYINTPRGVRYIPGHWS